MAATNRPVAKSIYLCDRVALNAANRSLDFGDVFNEVRAPGGSFPHTLARMCVFAQFEDGFGDAEFRVVVLSAATGQVAFYSPVYLVPFTSRLAVVSVNVRLTNCPFPAAGEYWVELYCDGVLVGDRALHVL